MTEIKVTSEIQGDNDIRRELIVNSPSFRIRTANCTFAAKLGKERGVSCDPKQGELSVGEHRALLAVVVLSAGDPQKIVSDSELIKFIGSSKDGAKDPMAAMKRVFFRLREHLEEAGESDLIEIVPRQGFKISRPVTLLNHEGVAADLSKLNADKQDVSGSYKWVISQSGPGGITTWEEPFGQ